MNNIGNRDYLQVLAYMFRFDAKTGYYLYPEAESTEDRQLWLNCGSSYEGNVKPRQDINVTKHGLKIPTEAADYTAFISLMKIREQEFSAVFYK